MPCKRIGIACAILLSLPVGTALASAVKVGVVGNAQGKVTAIDTAGAERVLKTGDDIFQNDVIRTDAGGNAQMLFLDKSALTLTPGSEVKIDSFIYDPNSSEGDLSLQEVKGAFRFIGGALSKENHVAIKTPVSTIGIRGGIEETHIASKGDGAEAIFIYGHDMTVQDKSGQKVTVTELGGGVSVQKGLPPITMSPAAVERKLEQFNAAAKNAQSGGDKSGTTDSKGDSSGGKTKKDEGAKDNSKDGSKDTSKDDSKGKSSDASSASGGDGKTTATGDSGSSSGASSGTAGSEGSGSATSSDTGSSLSGTAANSTSSGTSAFSNSATGINSTITSTVTALAQQTTTTASADSTTAATQQNTAVYTYSGLYNFETTSDTTSFNQGKLQFAVNGNNFNGQYTEIFPTAGTSQSISLPIPSNQGFSQISVALGGLNYTGEVYATPSMGYYFLQNTANNQQIAAAGYTIAPSNWAAAVSASDNAAMAAGTTDITFYNILPNLGANAHNVNDLTSFTSNVSNSNLSFSSSSGNNTAFAVNWSAKQYIGGSLNWLSAPGVNTSHSSMLVTYGDVTTTGSTLMSGDVFEIKDQPTLSMLNGPESKTGFSRVGSLVYGVGGNGPISGFVLEGIEPDDGTAVSGDPYQASGKHVFVPAAQATLATTDPAALSAAHVATIGQLNGYAAGNVLNSTAVTVLPYWSQSLNDVVLNKNIINSQISATITVGQVDNYVQALAATFGATAGNDSVLIDNQLFATRQDTIAFPSSSTAAQSGVLVGADLIANVAHSCSNCDFVQWGVWASEANVGTVSSPDMRVVDMVPVVFGTPTAWADVINNAGNIHALGTVTYTGAVYGSVYNSSTNNLTHQDGSFTSQVDLTNRTFNTFNGAIGAITFSYTGGPVALFQQTYSGGVGAGFSNAVGVTSAGGGSGTIRGSLFGPNAENVGGNFDVTATTNRATGVFLGGRPH